MYSLPQTTIVKPSPQQKQFSLMTDISLFQKEKTDACSVFVTTTTLLI